MAHTPGPWTIGKKPRLQPYIEGADGTPVCSCGGNAPGSGAYTTETFRRRDANARLIAAAPELLEAMKLLIADVADYPAWQRPCHALDVARAAIAKAEGRS